MDRRPVGRPLSILVRHSPPVRPTTAMLDNLGVDLANFRALQRLQHRELGPEDYDLLMQLHAKDNVKTLDKQSQSKVSETFTATVAMDTCAICMCAMSPGEEVSRLKCKGQHTYHAHCISEWLSTSSRCCPVDKEDLHERCLAA